MIVNRILDHIFVNTGNLAVLRVLNDRVVGISGRETARLANISLRTAQLALSNLEGLKIVKRQIGGREHLFTLNRDNFITKEIIIKLFITERRFKDSLINQIVNNLQTLADSIILFGSVARKEESIDSDMDICLVYSKNKATIEKIISTLRDDVYDTYGITLAPFYVTSNKFKTTAKKNRGPINEILKDGIVLNGSSINELIND